MLKFFNRLFTYRLFHKLFHKKKPLVLISIPKDNQPGTKIVLARKPPKIDDLIVSHMMK